MVQFLGPRNRRNRRVSGRLVAAMLTAACMTAALTSCGSSGSSGAPISLLPSTTAKGDTWEWSSACRVAPHGPGGCDASGPELAGHAQLAGNEWNLGSAAPAAAATGSLTMSVSSSGA